MPIALDRFIEAECGNSIDFCQVAIQHYSHAADYADHFVNLLDCDGGLCFLRHGQEGYSNIPPMRSRLCDFSLRRPWGEERMKEEG